MTSQWPEFYHMATWKKYERKVSWKRDEEAIFLSRHLATWSPTWFLLKKRGERISGSRHLLQSRLCMTDLGALNGSHFLFSWLWESELSMHGLSLFCNAWLKHGQASVAGLLTTRAINWGSRLVLGYPRQPRSRVWGWVWLWARAPQFPST